MRASVAASLEPWLGVYTNMSALASSKTTYKMAGPNTYFARNQTGTSGNLAHIVADGRAVTNLALGWYIEQDESYAIASRNILDAWSSITLINGTSHEPPLTRPRELTDNSAPPSPA